MNRIILLIFILLSLRSGAQNLVSNPGFETNSGFPSGPGQYSLATGWGNCNGGGSSDYFHTMGTGIVQLPNCFIGTVFPNSGDACMGQAIYYNSPANFREYISSQLISPLVIGQTYNVSFYITNGITSGTYGGGGIAEISACFSTQPLTQPGTDPIAVTPQVTYGTMFYSYTWQLISMQFVADSAYQFFAIGNFSDDASTTYQQFDPCPNFGAYYFFDDVVVEIANAAPVAIFNAPNQICPGTCTNFTNLSQNATSYLWDFTGATPSTSTDVNPLNICYNSPGSYSVSLVATNAITSDTLTLNNFITVFPYPSPQGIMQGGDTLFANQGAVSYQWYYGGNIINGAIDYYYIASQSGDYNIVATDANGCEVEAAIFDVVAAINNSQYTEESISVFPNPAGNILSLNCESEIKSIEVFNALGEQT
ncbi:MAG: PKD domain-containing protein, partial [Bacteroidetes bacterium]|nr:PKD domain-containing protein [Bacteroidota bacterium]